MRARLMAAFLALLACAPAMAQETPSVEIGLGYAYMRDTTDEENFPKGWYADIAGNISSGLAVVGEVGGSYKTIDVDGEDLKLRIHTFMGGLRLSRRGDGSTAYLQVLAGAAQAKASAFGVSETETDFALQPGVGLDLRISDGMAFRIGGDYRRIYFEGGHSNQWRATGGLVFRVGQR